MYKSFINQDNYRDVIFFQMSTVIVDDLSDGHEFFPIRVVNEVDDELLDSFEYLPALPKHFSEDNVTSSCCSGVQCETGCSCPCFSGIFNEYEQATVGRCFEI